MKGRLKPLNLGYSDKHPILLTANNPVVRFPFERAYRDNLHEGTKYVRNDLQQEFWIVGLQNSIQKTSRSICIKCRQRNDNPIHQTMVALASERLGELGFPFTHTGVNYFGPKGVHCFSTIIHGIVLPLPLSIKKSSTHRSCSNRTPSLVQLQLQDSLQDVVTQLPLPATTAFI